MVGVCIQIQVRLWKEMKRCSHLNKRCSPERAGRQREKDAVKIKGIEYHRFNDFTVRMNDGRVWRYEGKIKEPDGVKTLSDMLAASSSHPAIQSSSHSHFGGSHLDRWMDHAYHIRENQRHVPSCEKPHLSNSLTHFSSLWATRGSRRRRTSLTGVVRQRLHGSSRRLKICRRAKRDWHNLKESLIWMGGKSSECPFHSSEYGYPLASAKFG